MRKTDSFLDEEYIGDQWGTKMLEQKFVRHLVLDNSIGQSTVKQLDR